MMTKVSLIISIINLILYMFLKYDPKWFLAANYFFILTYKAIKNYRIDMLRYIYIFELKIRKNHLIDLINVFGVIAYYYIINNNFELNYLEIFITYITITIYVFYTVYYTDFNDLKK